MDRYFRYSHYLQDKYGGKTYKLPVHLPVTCPNRDGELGWGGCAFCGEEATGFEGLPTYFTVKEQLFENRAYIGNKYKAEYYIAYFQNFTSTYLPLPQLKSYIEAALEVEGLVEICLSTRPDCLSHQYVKAICDILTQRAPHINLSLELGLQTINYHTLQRVNRGHTLAEFIDAVGIAHQFGVEIGVHLILNLPGDDLTDAIENAKVLSALKVNTAKLHALYICKDSALGQLYTQGELLITPLDEYIQRVVAFLEHLDPNIAIQRLLGRAPKENTLFVNWKTSWWKIHQMIIRQMEHQGTYQGSKFNYLNGKAIQKFSQP